MAQKTHSLFRLAYHKKLEGIALDGAVLDVGGTKNGYYQTLFPGDPAFTVMNISEQYGYDIKADAEKPFPIADASFDHVLLLNVLELLYDYETTLRECFRVLKTGGTVVCANPFLVQVHHNPDDYFRFTDKALKRMFEEAGFAVTSVEPLAYGAFSVAYHHTSWLLPSPLRALHRWLSVAADGILKKLSNRYRVLSMNYPIGYFLVATKR